MSFKHNLFISKKTSYFNDSQNIETEPGVIPVKPVLVAQVKYLEITKDKKLRAPVFMQLREDKEAEECILP